MKSCWSVALKLGVYTVTRALRGPVILEIAVYFPSEGIELATLRVTPRPHPIIFLDGKIEMRLPYAPIRLRYPSSDSDLSSVLISLTRGDVFVFLGSRLEAIRQYF